MGAYDTTLSPEDEATFLKEFPDPQDTADYDMRGAWKAGATKSENGHLPDTWKKPNHVTFSDESMYHGVNGNLGGRWEEQPDKTWSFAPGKTNLKNFTRDALKAYFEEHEKGNKLVLPPSSMLDAINQGLGYAP